MLLLDLTQQDRYGKKFKLLLTDTDSSVSEIEANDMYNFFTKTKDMLDFSAYPESSKFYDIANKNVICKIEDQSKDIAIIQFGKLKPKAFVEED